ncbi:DUF433 domain-containing protein [Mycolicibacterium frederiksbergense]|uniref:DUF433 domain-containing protein n=1 Tax=Mycolicibacterium frederiksbergense TaxID=117567 RepID=UPI00265C121C|nr:DUF433 domain-containing protein [Mycolicibacterium frederiksbergense]MDO0977187.1 DUF433 domain-containing protein [Mycolicibacterium frederiksbergense]
MVATMVDIFKDPLFTPNEVSAYLKIPRSTVYHWLKPESGSPPLVHHLTPERRGAASVPFAALVEAFVLRALRNELKFTKQQIADTVADVRDTFGTDFALASNRIATDGIDIFVRHSEADFVRVGDHQVLIREVVGDYLKYIVWAPDSDYASRLRLRSFDSAVAPVIIDPRFGWGAPVVERNKVPVRAVIDLWASGESMATVADEYGLSEVEAEEICRVGLKQSA